MNTAVRDRRKRTVNSALWAAYGDAVGFMTELADLSLVKRRTGVSGLIRKTLAWQRQIGGRFGAMVELPAGTYSDDTQLRLATSRCIRRDGYFDVESFAKVELPVWLAYSLGSGVGSKAAATSLCGSTTAWYSNFFKTERSTYVEGGGNGAAMRVQPHVWSAANFEDFRTYIPDVLRNAISTHGHVRGVAGALLHAEALAFVFRESRLPDPHEWSDFGWVIRQIPLLVDQDGDLRTFWLPKWEAESNTSITQAAQLVAAEWMSLCEEATRHSVEKSNGYANVVERLGGLQPSQRGSGLKSALFSLCAVWGMRYDAPEDVIAAVANLLSSDTDTIATMAGALLGALPNQLEPSNDIQDRDLIISDAVRLYEVSQGSAVEEFSYPDLLYWQPPKSTLDVLAVRDGVFVIQGLGIVEPIGNILPTKQGDTCYQWFCLKSGQTLLCKRRREPRSSLSKKDEIAREGASTKPASIVHKSVRAERDLFEDSAVEASSNDMRKGDILSLDEAADEAIRSGFEAAVVGRNLLRFAEFEGGLELAIAYAAIVVKARAARIKKDAGSR